jgi:hypothetical protein
MCGKTRNQQHLWPKHPCQECARCGAPRGEHHWLGGYGYNRDHECDAPDHLYCSLCGKRQTPMFGQDNVDSHYAREQASRVFWMDDVYTDECPHHFIKTRGNSARYEYGARYECIYCDLRIDQYHPLWPKSLPDSFDVPLSDVLKLKTAPTSR